MQNETLIEQTDRVLARYGIVPAEADADDPADLDAPIAERDRVESFRVVRALVCWALVIHELRGGILR